MIGRLPQARIFGLVATATAWMLALVATIIGWRRLAAFAAVAGLGVAMLLLVRNAHRLRLVMVAVIPVVVFAAGALLIRRHERRAAPSPTDITATGAA